MTERERLVKALAARKTGVGAADPSFSAVSWIAIAVGALFFWTVYKQARS